MGSATSTDASQHVVRRVVLDPQHWAVAAAIASLAVIVGELDKAVRQLRNRHHVKEDT